MRRYIVAAFVLVIAAAPARAEWLEVGTSVSDAVYFMDAARIKTVGNYRQAWIKVDYSKDRSVTYREGMQLLSFDCRKQTVRILYIINKDSYGKTVNSQSFTDYGSGIGYDPIVPDSTGEMMSKLACLGSDQAGG